MPSDWEAVGPEGKGGEWPIGEPEPIMVAYDVGGIVHVDSAAPPFRVTAVCARGQHTYCGRSDCQCECHQGGDAEQTTP